VQGQGRFWCRPNIQVGAPVQGAWTFWAGEHNKLMRHKTSEQVADKARKQEAEADGQERNNKNRYAEVGFSNENDPVLLKWIGFGIAMRSLLLR
jgi:hypothetical protein